jgi:hypothetical protein
VSDNAACAQYATVECLTPPPPTSHRHPETGLDIAWVVLAGVLLVCVGNLIRPLVKHLEAEDPS